MLSFYGGYFCILSPSLLLFRQTQALKLIFLLTILSAKFPSEISLLFFYFSGINHWAQRPIILYFTLTQKGKNGEDSLESFSPASETVEGNLNFELHLNFLVLIKSLSECCKRSYNSSPSPWLQGSPKTPWKNEHFGRLEHRGGKEHRCGGVISTTESTHHGITCENMSTSPAGNFLEGQKYRSQVTAGDCCAAAKWLSRLDAWLFVQLRRLISFFFSFLLVWKMKERSLCSRGWVHRSSRGFVVI